jgi:hypothetical protein
MRKRKNWIEISKNHDNYDFKWAPRSAGIKFNFLGTGSHIK